MEVHSTWFKRGYGVYGYGESKNKNFDVVWAVDVHADEWAGLSGGGHVLFDVVSFSTDLHLNVSPRSHSWGKQKGLRMEKKV